MNKINREAILKNAKMGLWLIKVSKTDPQSNSMAVDESARELLGIREDWNEQEVFSYWFDRIHPAYLSYINEALASFESRKYIEVEYPWNHPVKGWRFVRCGGTLRETSKEEFWIEGYHQDVSDHLKDDEQLGSTHMIQDPYKFKKYSAYFMDVYDQMNEIDPETLQVNHIFLRKDKFPIFQEGTALPTVAKENVHPNDLDRFYEFIEDFKDNKTTSFIEFRVLTVDGGYVWVRLISQKVKFNGKERWLFCFFDINESKKAARLKEDNESLMSAIISENTDIFEFDVSKGRIYKLNKAKEMNYFDFLDALCQRYIDSSHSTLKRFFDLSKVQETIQKKRSVSLDIQRKNAYFGFDRITILVNQKITDRVLILIKEMDEAVQLQMIFSQYIENNFEGLCLIDLKKDTMIPLNLEDDFFLRSKVYTYSKKSSQFVDRYILTEDRENVKQKFQKETILKALRFKKMYYFSEDFRIPNQEDRRVLFQFQYFEESNQQLLLMVSDITEQYKREQEEKKQMEQIRLQAHIDHLTGLYNRYCLEMKIQEYLQEPRDTYSAFLLIDLDDFKDINDTFGHGCGDQALKDVAHELKQYFRSSDLLCRFGGDEFVVFMKDIKDKNVLPRLMKRFLDQMRLTYHNEQVQIDLKASIGIAICPEDGRDLNTLYAKADRALYRIKKSGKRGFAIYDPALDQ